MGHINEIQWGGYGFSIMIILKKRDLVIPGVCCMKLFMWSLPFQITINILFYPDNYDYY